MLLRLRNIAPFTAAVSLAAVLLPASGAVATTGGISVDPTAPALRVGPGVMVGSSTKVTGRIGDVDDGLLVDVQARQGTGGWKRVGSGRTHDDGAFSATWKATLGGRYDLRAVLRGAAKSAAQGTTDTAPTTETIVHKKTKATWFGPTENGTETACGVTLTDTVLGVAHKTLPCGTQVSFLFRGRRLTVPVIDRGPYRDGVDWDLTIGAADALGFTDTGLGTVGVMTLRDEPLAVLAKKAKGK